MDHNQQLINIINELNQKDINRKTQSQSFVAKTNTVKNIVEDVVDSDDLLKSYLKKFKNFKTKLNEERELISTQKSTPALNSYVESVSSDVAATNSQDFERYSRNDSRVFTNKAKKNETKATNMRWTQYSNSKANLTNEKKMAPLRLDRYSS